MVARDAVPVIGLEMCEDVALLSLERPPAFRFQAGQWVRMVLQTPVGEQIRTLSIASAPSDRSIDLGTRLSSSPFKQALSGLQPGDVVELMGPGGRMSLTDKRPVVFLAGGVGITPVRSMLRDLAHRGTSLERSLLFYGNRHEGCIPYRVDIEALVAKGLELVHVLEEAPSGWSGESGFIDAEMIARHVEARDAWFVVSGPPVMVQAMTRVLDELGVPEGQRTVESFGPAVSRQG